MVIKVVLLVLCALILIVLYRTEAVLKKFCRIQEPSQKLILRVKYILLVVTTLLFIATVALNQ